MVVGNDSDGAAKLWITSKLFTSTITVPLGPNISISSAYGEQSSRGRELMVESIRISNTTSRHHIFIPLESAVLVATFTYNGSSVFTANPIQPAVNQSRISTLCQSMSRCTSLGVYKIGAAMYTLCASSSRICMCRLRASNYSDNQKMYTGATSCRLLNQPRNGIDVHQISNTVTYESHKFNGNLLFALDNYVYQITPVYNSDGSILIPSNIFDCFVITRLQIIKSKLLIFCTNNSIVQYNMDTGDLDFFSQLNNRLANDLYLHFPCSDSADFSVNVINTEISYGTNNAPISNRSSGLMLGRFKFGECITNQSHHIFLYINNAESNSLHIIVNSSLFTLHNLTEVQGTSLAMCVNNEYRSRPVIIGGRYIIAYNLGCRTASVFDLQLQDFTSPIITQRLRSNTLPLATIISNLSVMIDTIEPITANTNSVPQPEEFIIVLPVLIIVAILGIIVSYSILNIIILAVIHRNR